MLTENGNTYHTNILYPANKVQMNRFSLFTEKTLSRILNCEASKEAPLLTQQKSLLDRIRAMLSFDDAGRGQAKAGLHDVVVVLLGALVAKV